MTGPASGQKGTLTLQRKEVERGPPETIMLADQDDVKSSDLTAIHLPLLLAAVMSSADVDSPML